MVKAAPILPSLFTRSSIWCMENSADAGERLDQSQSEWPILPTSAQHPIEYSKWIVSDIHIQVTRISLLALYLEISISRMAVYTVAGNWWSAAQQLDPWITAQKQVPAMPQAVRGAAIYIRHPASSIQGSPADRLLTDLRAYAHVLHVCSLSTL